VLGVLTQVVVAALGDAFQLVEAPRELELDVARACGVVRQLVSVVRAQLQHVGGHPEVEVPVHAFLAPVLVPLGRVGRGHEVLHLHLLELAGAEDPVLRGDLVAEALADLGDAERGLAAGRVEHVREVHEHALGRLRTQVCHGARVLDGAGVGLEHQVELARLGERAGLATVRACVRFVELVEPEALLAVRAVDQRVAEVGEVARGLEHLGRAEDRRIDQHDVVALLHHRPDPGVADVAQEQRAERPVVVGGAETAVDLGRGEDEPAPLAQVDDLVEVGGWHSQPA